jgi:hypothetical protein
MFLDVRNFTLHPLLYIHKLQFSCAFLYTVIHGILFCREYFQLTGIIKGVTQHHQQSPITRHTIHTIEGRDPTWMKELITA